jgi:hypothetical protein
VKSLARYQQMLLLLLHSLRFLPPVQRQLYHSHFRPSLFAEPVLSEVRNKEFMSIQILMVQLDSDLSNVLLSQPQFQARFPLAS